MMNFLKVVLKEPAITFFSTVGVLWSIYELLNNYFPNDKWVKYCNNNILCILIPAAATALLTLLSNKFLSYKIGETTYKVSVGNILNKRTGNILVGINRQMKTRGNEVGKSSIHKTLIDTYNEETLIKVFNDGKKDMAAKKTEFFQADIKGKTFLFLRMSDVDKNCAAVTNKEHIVKALDNLFENQKRLRLPQEKGEVYFPVLGTGECGLNENKTEAIKLIVDTHIKYSSKQHSNANRKIKVVHIVVYWKNIKDIEWGDLKKWFQIR